MRIAMAAASSGFPISLDFGYISGYTTDTPPPWWSSDAGGTDVKVDAKNVLLSQLPSTSTITITVTATSGLAPTVQYAKNNGMTTTYVAGFSVANTDYLKIGITAPQVGDGVGVVNVYYDGTAVATIAYDYQTP